MNRRGFIGALGAALAVAASMRLSSIPELVTEEGDVTYAGAKYYEVDGTEYQGFGMAQAKPEGGMLRYDGEDTFGVYME